MTTYDTETPGLSTAAVFESVKKGGLDILLDYIKEGGDLEAKEIRSRPGSQFSLAETIGYYLPPDDAAAAFEKMLDTGRFPVRARIAADEELINFAVKHAETKSNVCTPLLVKVISMGVNLANLANPPLCYAIKRQNYDLVKYLLENGADPSQPDDHSQDYPLRIAILKKNIDIFRLLVKSGADLKKCSTSPYKHDSLLHVAARSGLADFVEVLIDYKVDLQQQDYSGRTALILAAEAGNDREVELLIKAKAVIDHMDNYSVTALYAAASSGRLGSVKLLVSAGAEIDRVCSNISQRTALMEAVEKNHTDVAVYLIGKGADPYLESGLEKNTPAWVARLRGLSIHRTIQKAIMEREKTKTEINLK